MHNLLDEANTSLSYLVSLIAIATNGDSDFKTDLRFEKAKMNIYVPPRIKSLESI